MKSFVRLFLLLFILSVGAFTASHVYAQSLLDPPPPSGELEVKATKGDRLHPYYIHTSQKAYVAAFEISTQDGSVTLVYPNELQPDDQVESGYVDVLEAPRTTRLYTNYKILSCLRVVK